MRNLLLALAAAVLISLVFIPGLSGGFLLDDSGNLLENEAVQLRFSDDDFFSRAWNSSVSDSGDDARPLAMLSFALEFALAGEFDPRSMKIVNVSLHILNTLILALLLCVLFREVLRERALNSFDLNPEYIFCWALLLATIWALLPPNIGSTLYIVQRMNLLSAFFVLLGLLAYFYFRGLADSVVRRMGLFFAVAPIFLLGYWCKENALLGPLFILGFEAVAAIRNRSFVYQERLKGALIAACLFGVLVLLATGAFLFDEEFSRRPFDWYQRLALQPLALLYYVAGSFLPLAVAPRFYLDFMETATMLQLGWQAWLSIVIVVLTLAWSLWRILWKGSLLVYLTLGWFFLFHLLESTILPLEIAFQHRNYLPSVGLVAGLGILASNSMQRAGHWIVTFTKAVSLIFVLALLAGSTLESVKWGDTYTRLSMEVEKMPPSPRAHYQMGLWLYQNDPGGLFCEQAQGHFATARQINQANMSGYFGETILAERCGAVLDTEYWSDLNRFLAASPFATSNIKNLDLLTESCSDLDVADCARLEAAVEAASNNPTTTLAQQAGLTFLQAKLALYQGREAEAIRYAQEVLTLQPNYTNAHILLLDALDRNGGCAMLVGAIEQLRGASDLVEIERKVGSLEARYTRCF